MTTQHTQWPALSEGREYRISGKPGTWDAQYIGRLVERVWDAGMVTTVAGPRFRTRNGERIVILSWAGLTLEAL